MGEQLLLLNVPTFLLQACTTLLYFDRYRFISIKASETIQVTESAPAPTTGKRNSMISPLATSIRMVVMLILMIMMMMMSMFGGGSRLLLVSVQGFPLCRLPTNSPSSRRPVLPNQRTVSVSSTSARLGQTSPQQPQPESEEDLAMVVDTCDVAVFGGGFGGLYTALALSRIAAKAQSKPYNKPLDIVLVEPTESFVFLPLLYDLTVGTATEAEVCPFYTDLLRGTGIRHVRASLHSINAMQQQCVLKPTRSTAITTTTTTTPSSRSDEDGTTNPLMLQRLQFAAGVLAVGASPDRFLSSIPGAAEYAQPFYTAADAKRTRRLLNRLEADVAADNNSNQQQPTPPMRIAIVGGGFGGVELAASVQRRLPSAHVTLLCRSAAPLAGTRVEPLVAAALQKLGVVVETSTTVTALDKAPSDNANNNSGNEQQRPQVLIRRTTTGTSEPVPDDEPWDAVLWTAGSSPSDPVASGQCDGLSQSPSGRLAVDSTLRCLGSDGPRLSPRAPRIWALGDCAQVVKAQSSFLESKALPKTAQVAMQQAETVATNVWRELREGTEGKSFVFQDLGSMLTLGGPNAAVMAPREGALAPIFEPVLDTANTILSVADDVLTAWGQTPAFERLGLIRPEALGLSLSTHGLYGVENDLAPGTLAGTLSGVARRTVYAARMPTNQQRAVSILSAAISTAASLAKEVSDKRMVSDKKNPST